MPVDNVRSKDERLARIRRNQQNCRDRKRTRMAELEQQVKNLQAQHLDFKPSARANASSLSFRLDTVLQENAALRRLLKAIGLDERSQHQYLETTLSYRVAGVAHWETSHTLVSPTSIPEDEHPGPMSLPPFPQGRKGQVPDSWDIQTSDSDFPIPHHDSGVDTFPIFDEWLVDFESENIALPHRDGLLPQMSTLDAGSSQMSPILATGRQSSHDPDGSLSPQDITCQAEEEQPEPPRIASCLTDADVPLPEDDSTTLCSVALSMVLRHNKKRLTTTQLNERLRVGFRGALQPSQGCRVENRVLFNVLAEICT